MLRELYVPATIEVLNGALIDQGIDVSQIMSIIYLATNAPAQARFRVIYRVDVDREQASLF